MNLGGRIKQERERQKLTQEELARRAGMPGKQQTIQALEGRDSSRSQYAAALCNALGVTLEWALTGEGPKHPQPRSELEPEGGARAYELGDPVSEGDLLIMEERVNFSGGYGAISYEAERDSRPAVFRRSYFQREQLNPLRCKRFRVVGRSMEPLLFPGDAILVNLEETQVREGLVYAFRHGDELKVKRLIPKADGSLVLRSVNREEYPDDVVPASQVAEQITIIGRVRDRSGRGGL